MIERPEPWIAAYDELSKHAVIQQREITTSINKQLGGHKRQQLKWLEELPLLDLLQLPEAARPVVLEAMLEDPANSTTQGSPLRLTDQAMHELHNMWASRQGIASSAVFAIVEKNACANSFFQHLEVSDSSAVQAVLDHESEEWTGGRVAYIGVILQQERQIKAIAKLLEPVIEPVLSLLLSVEWEGGPLEMTVQMFMHNKDEPEVCVASIAHPACNLCV